MLCLCLVDADLLQQRNDICIGAILLPTTHTESARKFPYHHILSHIENHSCTLYKANEQYSAKLIPATVEREHK